MEDLLFLSHRIPYPPDKGEKIRAWNFLRHLARRYRVHLACFVDDPADLEHLPALEEICATLCWRRLFPGWARLRSLRGVAAGAPLTRGYFRDRGLQQDIDRIVARHRPSRYFVYSSAMAPYIERHPPARCVIDMVDVDSEKWRHYAETATPLSRLVYRREARTLLALERRSAGLADRVLFVSRAEADLFRRLAPEAAARVRHVSNGVDTDYFDPSLQYADPFAGEPALVFVGAMNYRPNIEAAAWFAREVMPILRRAGGAPSFWIVGSRPSAAVRRLAAGDVRVTGRVEDVRPYLAHAAAVVAPLRIARGVQNKVLEAMAMAAPVVLTPPAREGIEVRDGEELLEAAGAPAFAAAVERILAGGGRDMGRRARARVRRDFGWASSLAALDAQLEPDASESRGGAAVAARAEPLAALPR